MQEMFPPPEGGTMMVKGTGFTSLNESFQLLSRPDTLPLVLQYIKHGTGPPDRPLDAFNGNNPMQEITCSRDGSCTPAGTFSTATTVQAMRARPRRSSAVVYAPPKSTAFSAVRPAAVCTTYDDKGLAHKRGSCTFELIAAITDTVFFSLELLGVYQSVKKDKAIMRKAFQEAFEEAFSESAEMTERGFQRSISHLLDDLSSVQVVEGSWLTTLTRRPEVVSTALGIASNIWSIALQPILGAIWEAFCNMSWWEILMMVATIAANVATFFLTSGAVLVLKAALFLYSMVTVVQDWIGYADCLAALRACSEC
jgi:hypothetical protein